MSLKPNSNEPITEKNSDSYLNKEIPLPSQSKKNLCHQIFNPFTDMKQPCNKSGFKNQTQFIPNSTDKNPFFDNSISEDMKNGVIKIKLFKSTIKPYRPHNPEKKGESSNLELLRKKVLIKNEELSESPLIIEKRNDKDSQYKMLIKKIAMQLKKKIKPKTKGFFYMKVIRNEKYLNLIKKLAQGIKNTLGLHPPTNGAFYSYMIKEEKKLKKNEEEKYKLLIKKISSQLKKRVKFPTCKIIKIYESYRTLIKRIACSLKKSMKNNSQNPPLNCDNEVKMDNNEEIKNEKEMDIDEPIHVTNEIKEEIKNENNMDIETPICALNENQDKDLNNIKRDRNELDENDIEMDEKRVLSENPLLCEGIQTEIKKDSTENKIIKTSSYKEKSCWISSKKKSEDNLVSNYTFSKMEVIDNKIPNSTEQKRFSDIIKDSEENKNVNNEKNEIPKMNINTDELILVDKKEEVIKCGENEEITGEKDKVNFNEKQEIAEKKNSPLKTDIIRNGKSMPNSTKNKKLFFNLSVMKKENIFDLGQERKIANKSHSKINAKLNLDNLNNIYKNISNIEHKDEKENNLSLQDIEITKSNFINQFEKFLEQENIKIINNFPESSDERNIILFQQSNFWYLVMTYLFYKSCNLSIYNILYLLEQYYSWAQDKTKEMFCSMKERIKEYITSHNSKEKLNQFLFMNKLDNLDKIFEKFESPSLYSDTNKDLNNDYIEIKIEDLCFLCDKKGQKCKCDLCTDNEACIQKVCDLNKNRVEIVNNSSMDIIKKEITIEEIIKRNNNKVVFHNNEELFYKGELTKKVNNIFNKSKTILENIGNLEYIHNQIINPNNIEKNENEEKVVKFDNIENNKNNHELENNDILIEDKKEFKENVENKKDSSFVNSPEKTFKNISKSERKPQEEKEEYGKVLSEGKDPDELKEENENIEGESKILKKEKKSRKGKSRKKNNKKKETISKNEDKEYEKDEKDGYQEEEKEEKSAKKKRKSTNRSSLKKNKSKNCQKNEENEDKEEKEETNESEEINLGSRSVNKLIVDSGINNSKRKKSKTPNKKKSRKH